MDLELYKNILVCIDALDDEKNLNKMFNKAISIAKRNEAKLTFIYVNVNFSDLYTGLISIDFSTMQNNINSEHKEILEKLKNKFDYPMDFILGSGEIDKVVTKAIKENHYDLIVVGHHQDFLGKLFSSTRGILNRSSVDALVVPLN